MHACIQIPMSVCEFGHSQTSTDPISSSLLDFFFFVVLFDAKAETGKQKDVTNIVNM